MACRRDQEATADWPDSGISGYSWSSEKEDVSALFLWGSSHQWLVSHSSPGSGERHLASSEFGETDLWLIVEFPARKASFFLPWGISWNNSKYSSAKLRIWVLFSYHTTQRQSIKRLTVSEGWRVTMQGGRKSQCNGKHVSFRVKRQWFRPLLCCLPVTVLLVHCSSPRASGSLALKCIW